MMLQLGRSVAATGATLVGILHTAAAACQWATKMLVLPLGQVFVLVASVMVLLAGTRNCSRLWNKWIWSDMVLCDVARMLAAAADNPAMASFTHAILLLILPKAPSVVMRALSIHQPRMENFSADQEPEPEADLVQAAPGHWSDLVWHGPAVIFSWGMVRRWRAR